MAYLDRIFFHSTDMRDKNTMTVYAKMKPDGELAINVPVPEKFYASIVEMAQSAIDEKEAQMRAEILADTLTPASDKGGADA